MEPLKKSFKVVSEDKEVSAISIIIEIVSEFDSHTQQRILGYVQQRAYAGEQVVGGLVGRIGNHNS